jgi:hypothetical protein
VNTRVTESKTIRKFKKNILKKKKNGTYRQKNKN